MAVRVGDCKHWDRVLSGWVFKQGTTRLLLGDGRWGKRVRYDGGGLGFSDSGTV